MRLDDLRSAAGSKSLAKHVGRGNSPGQGQTAELRLQELKRFAGETAELAALKKTRIVRIHAEPAKVIVSGSIDSEVKLSGLGATPGAKAAIEAARGSVA